MGGLTTAMEGMHQEHMMLKKQFRTYLADHEKFAGNVRRYVDELDIDDDAKPAPTAVTPGQNDNERRDPGKSKSGGKVELFRLNRVRNIKASDGAQLYAVTDAALR